MTSAVQLVEKLLQTLSEIESRFPKFQMDLDEHLEVWRQLQAEKRTVENLLVKGASDSAALREWMARAEKAESQLAAVTLSGDSVATDSSLYRGNSVRYWWDKCQAYKDAFRERDDARTEASNAMSLMRAAEACTALANARAERAEKALAEVQPVLDAVVSNFDKHGEVWNGPPFTILQAYADRRRDEMVRAAISGGAS